jgi:threonylcarbamoyladenosine tRNA methylthiotransferase MtaB
MHGFTDNYIRVEINLPRDNESLSQIKDNTIVDVRLGDWNTDKTALMGEIVQ